MSFHQNLTPRGKAQSSPAYTTSPRAINAPATSYPQAYLEPATIPGMKEIKSAESEVLTSPGLSAFKELLSKAQSQYECVSADFETAKTQEHQDVGRYQSWDKGWLLKHIFKNKFAQIKTASDNATDLRKDLQEQLIQSKLDTQFDMPDGVAKSFDAMCEAFKRCSTSERIWDNVAHRTANQFAERTIASRIIDLKPVRFDLSKCGVIETQMLVPYLQNANGGDMYFYPGFVVYWASATNYALIEYKDLTLKVGRMRFHEEKSVPLDATQVGTTWAKCNKDGTPDRRFKDNYQIPIMQYAILTIESKSGVNEEYLLSNVQAAEAFGTTWMTVRANSIDGV